MKRTFHFHLDDTNYKLCDGDLRSLVHGGHITQEDCDRILEASHKRQPGTHAEEVVNVNLSRTGGVVVRSIAFYGGEHFGKPYCYIAEVRNLTTQSCFSRFLNANGLQWIRRQPAFTY